MRNILDFPGAVRAAGARRHARAELPLDRSRSSTPPTRSSAWPRERFTKNLWTERALGRAAAARHRRATRATQARYVVEQVLEQREAGDRAEAAGGAVPRLAPQRARSSSSSTRRNIPFVKFGGLKFLEAAHVKDVLALPALGREPARPRRRLPRRCSSCPASGRRPPARVLDAIAEARRSAARRSRRSTPPPRRAERLAGASPTLFARLRARPRRLAGRARAGARAGTSRTSSACYDDARVARAPTSCSSSRSPRGYPSRERFLTELTLDPPDATSDEAGAPLLDEDYLILSTIHSAKGQEWTSVFVLNVVDGCIPSDLGDRHRPTRSRRSGGCSTSR